MESERTAVSTAAVQQLVTSAQVLRWGEKKTTTKKIWSSKLILSCQFCFPPFRWALGFPLTVLFPLVMAKWKDFFFFLSLCSYYCIISFTNVVLLACVFLIINYLYVWCWIRIGYRLPGLCGATGRHKCGEGGLGRPLEAMGSTWNLLHPSLKCVGHLHLNKQFPQVRPLARVWL